MRKQGCDFICNTNTTMLVLGGAGVNVNSLLFPTRFPCVKEQSELTPSPLPALRGSLAPSPVVGVSDGGKERRSHPV